MELRVKSGDITRAKAECLVVCALAEGQLPTAAIELDASLGQLLSRSLAHSGEKLKAGGTQLLTLPEGAPFQRALLVGAGKAEDLKGVRQAASAVAKALDRAGVKAAAWLWHDETERALVLAAEHLVRGFYQYTTTKTKNLPKNHLKKITFYVSNEQQTALKAAVERGEALGNAANFTRELGNLPGNICTPSYLAETAETLAADDAGLTVEVLEEKQLKKLGMGALLAVARGSDEPPRLIVMNYRGAGDAAPVVLVGKGITFDTGGISIKPGPGMDEMKFDMCGAASVLGVMHLLKTLKPAVNVIGVVAAAENMPSGHATKPGDVVTTMAGLTVEILNTDAEGRLVLCDALTYVERFNPAAVIDIATLTGACVIALGNAASGLFSTDDDLATALLAAGETAQDRAWRMPVWDEYDDSLKSNFADYANIGGREAGSVTAACFLKQFTKAYKWAHLDIAGTAWTGGAAKGASGRPVALLAEYLLNIYGAAEPNREGV